MYDLDKAFSVKYLFNKIEQEQEYISSVYEGQTAALKKINSSLEKYADDYIHIGAADLANDIDDHIYEIENSGTTKSEKRQAKADACQVEFLETWKEKTLSHKL